MKRLCLALAVAVLLLLTVGVGTAAAEDLPGMQEAGLPAEGAPDAESAEGTAQQEPTTEEAATSAPIPPDAGVTQGNDASSSGTAGNLNATKQDADQEQDGGIQAIGQSAKNDQDALALAFTLQKGAENTNTPVRVLSEGDSGPVTQSNDASSTATAGNLNATKQDADQKQDGDCKCGPGGTQAIGQSAESEQEAKAAAKTVQVEPTNTNISVRVLSPGNDGPVTQTNTASSNATAGNVNLTKQDADQKQDGDCKCGPGGTQAIGQSADSDQKAAAAAETVQIKPSNRNISVRVLSEGDDGPVTQTNDASSKATAGNINLTKQDADQTQDGSGGLQAIGQSADSDQKALAASLTAQKGATNENISVRVLSPGKGGSVTQSNKASSNAKAGNLNATKQDADQEQGADCKCGDGGKQLIGQSAESDQKAVALAATFQLKPSNSNTSVRVLSEGDDGDVTQTNDASSTAFAGNLNLTKQDADQRQEGSGIQAIGQVAKNEQDAIALAATFQIGASNSNTPVRVKSPGKSGSVTQTNDASSTAFAGNLNLLKQDADQTQGGNHDKDGHEGHDGKDGDKHDCCGTGIQAIGQLAKNDQDAKALALTVQVFRQPCVCREKGSIGNGNTPTSVLSHGPVGDVKQSNTASSTAGALNVNLTKQEADQDQGSSCKCWRAFGIQAIGQLAKSEQTAVALAATFQLGASNTNTPTHVGGHEKDGHDPKDDHESTREVGDVE